MPKQQRASAKGSRESEGKQIWKSTSALGGTVAQCVLLKSWLAGTAFFPSSDSMGKCCFLDSTCLSMFVSDAEKFAISKAAHFNAMRHQQQASLGDLTSSSQAANVE